MYDINLYPPIFGESYIKVAIAGSSYVRIYFQLSDLNTLDDMKNVAQVTVRDQITNENVLAAEYLIGIAGRRIQEDNTIEGKQRYYITIYNTAITNGFVANKYYKIQVRFIGKNAANPPDPTSTAYAAWQADNLQYLSEWSTVALLKIINQPTTNIKLNGEDMWVSDIIVYPNQIETNYVNLTGTVTFEEGSAERLDICKIELYERNQDRSRNLVESVQIKVDDNTFQYAIQTSLGIGITYNLTFRFYSNSGYYWERFGDIKLIRLNPALSDIKLTELVNNNTGSIRLELTRDWSKVPFDATTYFSFVDVVPSTGQSSSIATGTLALAGVSTVMEKSKVETNYDAIKFSNNVVKYNQEWERMIFFKGYSNSLLDLGDSVIIRRASSINDFNTWMMLSNFQITQQNITNLHWFDYTAEPGLWYRYQVVRYNSQGTRTAELFTDANHPVMLDTEDIFLNANGEQLIVKFNPSITSLTNKTAESITDTIGSQYPFIQKNGNVNYRTFSLSGTISYFMDMENHVFHGSQEELYGNSYGFYQNYNQEHGISIYNDHIYEKMFRKKVIDFLQSSKIKLFRSLTEGNILVKLSNITLTPNQTLGRRIYNFSCTATEIGKCNETNYNKYNILKDNIKIITREEAFNG